jgi:hypothetical protein
MIVYVALIQNVPNPTQMRVSYGLLKSISGAPPKDVASRQIRTTPSQAID